MAAVETQRDRSGAGAVACTRARKARLVLEHIRGKLGSRGADDPGVPPRAVAKDVGKVLQSAIANAETRTDRHDGDELVVAVAYADEGPTLKRWRARARGRVNRIRKRTCHITIELVPNPVALAAAAARGDEPGAPSRAEARGADRRTSVATARAVDEAVEDVAAKRRRARRVDGAAEARGRPATQGQAPRARRPVMGQKVHPGGLRVGVIHTGSPTGSRARRSSRRTCLEDVKIRDHIYGKLSHAGLSDIHIRKDKQRITVDIYTARPGIVIGKSGAEVDALRRELHAMTAKNVQVNITEIKRPELDAKLVAQSIAEQLQNRVSFRRAMKRSLASSIRSGARA